jgi:dTDP-glucose 4,6-dehydratase
MSWKDRRVLVSGAGGFIGSHLAERLVALGAQVRAFVRYNSRGDRGFIDGFAPHVQERVETVMGDLRDADAVKAAMNDIDYVFHLGAMVAIPYSYVHPREVVESNVLGTLNILQAARSIGVQKVVHTSTSEVYGTAQTVPMSESHPLCGQSPYSASKIAADQLVESFYRSFELPVVTVRPFNAYGPRQSARAVIPTIISQALAHDKVQIGATHTKRDLTFVTDTVEGFILLSDCAEAVGQTTNVGSGIEVSIKELAERVISQVGRNVEIVFDPTRLRPGRSEVERLFADNSKVKSLVGWEPKTSLDEGLRQTIQWVADHFSMYKPQEYAL